MACLYLYNERTLMRGGASRLGEPLGDESGKVTGRRILEGDDYRYVKMEISCEASATILGLEGQ